MCYPLYMCSHYQCTSCLFLFLLFICIWFDLFVYLFMYRGFHEQQRRGGVRTPWVFFLFFIAPRFLLSSSEVKCCVPLVYFFFMYQGFHEQQRSGGVCTPLHLHTQLRLQCLLLLFLLLLFLLLLFLLLLQPAKCARHPQYYCCAPMPKVSYSNRLYI